MNEIFKDIEGYEGFYQVSSIGRIRSISRKVRNGVGFKLTTERILKWHNDGNGYFYTCLSVRGSMKYPKIHKLVAESFLGDRPKGFQINHIDGNKSNNAVCNLEYCSSRDNIRHAFRTGLNVAKKGENHGCSKLTRSDVIEIKTYLKVTKRFYGMLKPLAAKYGVCISTISEISRGKAWVHITV
jgi:hypothetical protein